MGKRVTEEERSFLLLSGTPSVAYANQPPEEGSGKRYQASWGRKVLRGMG